jgi:hypothetical protein
MIVGRIYYQIIFSTSFGVALTLALIILAYLKSKPTGMQTLLDLFIKDFIIIATAYRIIVALAIFLICNVAPVDYWLARGLAVLIKLFLVFLFVDIFILIIVRYIIIYYNAYISEICDKKLLGISRIVIFISSIILWIGDVIDFSSSGKAFFTALSQIEGKIGSPNRMFGLIVLMDAILLILTQIKIEKDKLLKNESSTKWTHFSFSAIRGVTIAVLIICLIVLGYIIIPYVTYPTDVFLNTTLILGIFVGNICPAIIFSVSNKLLRSAF